MDFLEHAAIKDVIVCSTVLEEVSSTLAGDAAMNRV
jgi:hypothetical protein